MDRVAFVMHVKEGEEEEYIRRHKAVWPEILADMEEAGVHQMNIFMQGQQLFLYMEVENYIEASHLLAERPDSVRWEEFMTPIMEDSDGESYDPANPYPESLPEVFYWRKGQDG